MYHLVASLDGVMSNEALHDTARQRQGTLDEWKNFLLHKSLKLYQENDIRSFWIRGSFRENSKLEKIYSNIH